MRQRFGLWFSALAITIQSLLVIAVPAVADTGAGNLIPNSDFSTQAAGVPAGWEQGGWGTNTRQLSTATDASGTYLVAQISGYQDGDAKWYFDPVAVSPGTKYDFRDSYRSAVPTLIFAAINHTNGTTTYQYLGTEQPTQAWALAGFSLTTPSDVSSLSVYHILNQNGELDTRAYWLSPSQAIDTSSGVPNGSLEQTGADLSSPASWQSGGYGAHTTQFQYLNTGHSGSRSASVSVSNYSDGDAKWYFNPVAVTPGSYLEFDDYYQANVDTHVTVDVQKSDGSDYYIALPVAPPSSGWSPYSARFTVPAGAVSLTVFHALVSNGTLTTDDYGLKAAAMTGFNRALVTLTFDDGWQSIYKNALPRLNTYGYKSTQFLVSDFIGQPGYMTLNQAKAFAQGGHEIASHTVDHPDLTTLSTAEVISELTNSKSYFQTKLGTTPTDFATPYGAYNQSVMTQIQAYYGSHRGVEDGLNSKDNFNRYDLKVKNIGPSTSTADIKSWLTQAATTHTWLILVYHQIDTSGEDFSATPTQLSAELQAIKTSGLPVVTVRQALSEVSPQLP
jgi:peptidoglycan/xylan/chitin deacetylase (PgdA/CDA1 family)